VKVKNAFRFACIFLAAIAATSCWPGRRQSAGSPNIILITIDALRPDHLSVYGYPYQTSPHIDDFAEKSVLFENAYCTTPKTSASLASMMTGLHPFFHRTRPIRDTLEKEFVTLAEALKMRGYSTTAIVDNPNLSKNFNFNQGFDRYLQVWDKTTEKEESTPYITRQILEFLSRDEKSPFFLWAHYIEPHYPFLPPQRFIEERPQGRAFREIEPKIIAGAQRYVTPDLTEGYFLARYDGAVKYMDSEIEKILDLVYKKGYQKNSVIILTADHGEELGEHNYFYNHGPLTFGSSTRVPLIMSVPGEKSRRIKSPVSLMDLYPTLLDWAGLVPPYEIQGQSLFERPGDRFLFIEGSSASYSVVYKKYQLVRTEKKLARELGLEELCLFDFFNDPTEKDNFASRRKSLVDLMTRSYQEFYDKYGYRASTAKPKEEPKLTQREIEHLKALGYIR
jgi:arylsulfatase A-like enzyme